MPRKGWYVYAVRNEHGDMLYIGKGCQDRYLASARRLGGYAEVLELFNGEVAAFKAERKLIAKYRPSMNKTAGGDGGRSRRRIVREPSWVREINAVGSKRYAARFLLTKLDEDNCASYGVSKVGLNRIREVANGPPC
jgi:hypothetical protein